MKVKELIEQLQKYADSNKDIFTEGCDCEGEGGEVVEKDGYILITRA